MLVGVRKRKKEMKLFKIHRENLYGREKRKKEEGLGLDEWRLPVRYPREQRYYQASGQTRVLSSEERSPQDIRISE